jgi:hypothetical protein
MKRASPSQQRKALEIAHMFVKMGIGFVPVPVKDSHEFDIMAQQSIEKMTEMADSLESETAGTKEQTK